MFEQFSSGYYLGRLYVQAHDGSRAVLRESHHRRVREQLYRSRADSATARGDNERPLVMRYRRQHFAVDSDEAIPERTLAIPREWLADRPDPLEPREVFLAKADRARQLLRFAAGSETADSGVDPAQSDENSVTDDRFDGRGPFVPQALGDVARPTRRQ